MGSFAAPVALPELLRPWASAGLELLFLPEGLRNALPTLQDEAPQPAPPAAAPSEVSEPAPGVANPVDWPAPWDALAARVTTPPRLILTYAGLAEDLSGAADPVWRRQLQSLLSYLGWTRGVALFWPLFHARDASTDAPFASDIFAQGVRHFGVRHVVCLGVDAAQRARLLFPQEGKATEVLVHAGPDPAELSSLLPHELHRALAGLKALALG